MALIYALIALADRGRRTVIAALGGMSVGVSAIVLNDRREVLLVRHTYKPGWYTPGGGVRGAESPLAAVKRELREETGLEITGAPTLLHVYVNRYRGAPDFPVFFLVESFDGAASVKDRFEIAEIGWFPIEAAIEMAAPPTAKVLTEFRAGRGFREIW